MRIASQGVIIYFHHTEYATFQEAVDAARGMGWEASIQRDGSVVAGWGFFGGLRIHDNSVRA